MKYVVFLCDGLADRKIAELGNKTIIQAANIPNIHALARGGSCGLVQTTPNGMPPGSDICNLSIFGYNPAEYYTGRSPLEALSIGIELGANDTAFRCNTVMIKEDIMASFTANHIKEQYVKNIIDKLNIVFKDEPVEFFQGVGYRNIMVARNMSFDVEATPPHDITDKNVKDYAIRNKSANGGADFLNNIMQRAKKEVFNGSVATGDATNIWLWGEGKKPTLPKFQDKFGLKGAVISAVDLLRGIGRCADMSVIEVPNITGWIDTNFKGKAEYALEALKTHDYVFIHVEATDEAGHLGSVKDKIKAIELIDSEIVARVMKGLRDAYGDDFRVLLAPDHATPIELKTHSNERVPAILYGKGVESDSNELYSEDITPTFDLNNGYKIADLFLK